MNIARSRTMNAIPVLEQIFTSAIIAASSLKFSNMYQFLLEWLWKFALLDLDRSLLGQIFLLFILKSILDAINCKKYNICR